jgi:glycerol-3-phosphate dehydrogenase subunit C
MTTTYDPQHHDYLDEADVRAEMSRVFDMCGSCRQCVSLCGVFPNLFDLLDRSADSDAATDAGLMTPAEQDAVASECSQCKLCAIGCPHILDRASGDADVDMPRLMLRATAMRVDVGLTSLRSKVATQLLGRSTSVGRIGSAAAPLVNRIVAAEPDSVVRRIAAKATGISAVRLIAPFARERFTTWFSQRPKILLRNAQGKVTVLPTCIVDYHEPNIGKDLVKVYERNGIECDVSGAGCCGAPWLQAGDIERFAAIADKNVERLAGEIRSGTDVVVPQPSCAYVLKRDYIHYVTSPERRADAELVAAHTFDASEYLMRVHRADETVLDTDFDGEVARSATYHVPCHTRAQEIGFAGRDLLQLTGVRVRTIQGCAGANGVWGLSTEHEESSLTVARQLGDRIEAATPATPAAAAGATVSQVVVGDCHRANTAIVEQIGGEVMNPMSALARAYGIPAEP